MKNRMREVKRMKSLISRYGFMPVKHLLQDALALYINDLEQGEFSSKENIEYYQERLNDLAFGIHIK